MSEVTEIKDSNLISLGDTIMDPESKALYRVIKVNKKTVKGIPVVFPKLIKKESAIIITSTCMEGL
jgi:hypothetical protein